MLANLVMMQSGSVPHFSMQYYAIHCLPHQVWSYSFQMPKYTELLCKICNRWWDIYYFCVYFDWLLSCTIKTWSLSDFFQIRWVGSEWFTSLISDRQPLFRTSCLMLRFWLWWSAVYVTIWTTEARTMLFKPSKWAQAGVRHKPAVTWVTGQGFLSFRTGSALALLYGTSATLEHHHFNHAVMILQSEVRSSLFINIAFS